ncbi:hypothetical protein JXD38_06605, partial [candidate division WOR-3 bacterium]|nr:hypothetical protein [candidate division WOR-3 bacterium]
MSSEPYSKQAWEELQSAYNALSEPQKTRLVGLLHSKYPRSFADWIRFAKLHRGYPLHKVQQREAGYGKRLDDALFSEQAGDLTEFALEKFLEDSDEVDRLRLAVPGSFDRSKAESDIDEYVNDELADRPLAQLAGAFFKCFWDLEPTEDGVRSALTAFQRTLSAEAQKLESWARDVELGRDVDPAEVVSAVESASASSAMLSRFLDAYRAEVDLQPQEWKTPKELRQEIDRVAQAIARRSSSPGRIRIVPFLADRVVNLKVSHRSSNERKRLEKLRDDAAGELQDSLRSGDRQWIDSGPGGAKGWLEWAFDLEGEELESVQEQLRRRGYPFTAELVEFGDRAWIVIPEVSAGPSVSVVSSGVAAQPEETPATLAPPGPPLDEISQVGGGGEASEGMTATVAKDVAELESEQEAGEQPSEETTEAAPLWGTGSSLNVAESLLDRGDNEPERGAEICELIWKLAREGERGIAWRIALLSELMAGQEVPECPAWAFKALALTPYATSDNYEVQNVLRELFSSSRAADLFRDQRSGWNRALRLLLTAGALRPAALAPTTNALAVLSVVHHNDWPSVHELVQKVIEFSRLNLTPGPEFINAALTLDEWKIKCEQYKQSAAKWREDAKQFRTRYAPATKMWLDWLQDGGLVAQILECIGRDDPSYLKSCSDKLGRVGWKLVNDEIDRSRKEHGARHSLVGAPRTQLESHVFDALRLALGWIKLAQARPGKGADYWRAPFETMRASVSRLADAAKSELEGELGHADFDIGPVGIGAWLLQEEIDSLRMVLSGEAELARPSAAPADLLNEGLWRVEGWQPWPRTAEENQAVAVGVEPPRNELRTIVEAIGRGLPDLLRAFGLRLKSGDHRATQAIVDALARGGSDPAQLDELRVRRSESVAEWIAKLSRRADSARLDLGDAFAKGRVDQGQFERESNRLECVEEELHQGGTPGEERFDEHERTILGIEKTIAEGSTREKARVRKRLVAVREKASDEDYQRVEEIVEHGDIFLADDYIDRLTDGRALPPREATERSHFEFLFGGGSGVHRKILEFLGQRPPDYRGLVGALRDGRDVCGIQVGTMDREARERSAAGLDAWLSMSRRRRIPDSGGLVSIFRWLGFGRGQVRNDKGQGGWKLQFPKPLECPVPQFGSGAGG